MPRVELSDEGVTIAKILVFLLRFNLNSHEIHSVMGRIVHQHTFKKIGRMRSPRCSRQMAEKNFSNGISKIRRRCTYDYVEKYF